MQNQANNKRQDQRIAIIGAGAAGLVAAESLKNKGYKHITLFEKNDHVGGKCRTEKINGKPFELGAGIVAGTDLIVMRLAKKYRTPLQCIPFGKSIHIDEKTGRELPKMSWPKKILLLKQIFFTYRRLLRTYKTVSKPGFTSLDSELSIPFSRFAAKYHIEALAKEFKLFFTGFGYGYFEDISTAYVLKYISWNTIKSFVKRRVYFFPEGIQYLWASVAQSHDVRFNTNIQSITRDKVITIVTDKEEFVFDSLILTSPLDEALKFLQPTKQERQLFSKISYTDYRTVACRVTGLDKMNGFIPDNYSASKIGSPVFFNRRFANSNVYTFYVLADGRSVDDKAVQNVTNLVEKMGGVVKKVYSVTRWKYFPHVDSVTMKNGYFDALEAIQGANHTFYVGELMSFSTVGLTSEYADDLVERFF
ncbi:MAG: FAD-dependent oxidoreductase [Patescibacteria group bacterium]